MKKNGFICNFSLLFIIAFCIGIFIYINNSKPLTINGTSSIKITTINDVPVRAIYDKSKYVVNIEPEKIDVLIKGNDSEGYLIKQLVDFNVDVSDYDSGIYEVDVDYSGELADSIYYTVPSKIKVTIVERASKTFNNVYISTKNLCKNCHASVLTIDDRVVDVTVSGEKNIIDNLTENDLEVYVDLKDYEEGQYEIPICVEISNNDNNITKKPSKEKVSIIIK